MIDTHIGTHDKFSIEFKIGFYTSNKPVNENKFKINSWVFIPNGLDINRYTYTKQQFYSDIKSNVRLITPIYTLDEILQEDKGPFPRLRKAIDRLLEDPSEEHTESYTYQIKMLLCIVKSALRNANVRLIAERNDLTLVEQAERFVALVNEITLRFRKLRDEILEQSHLSQELKDFFLFGDEYLGSLTKESMFILMRRSRKKAAFGKIKPLLLEFVSKENNNSVKMCYALPDEADGERNSQLLIKRVQLKKFIESDLYLQRIKKTDGALAKEFYYGVAAGLAMIFATVISFIATQHYGNFTSALFFALVISYIFKDRIKEAARLYFSSKLDQKYFDWKWNVSIRNQKIGIIREAFDFIAQESVPEHIMELRNKSPLVAAENKSYEEKVILYRKRVILLKKDLEKYKEYRLAGINDILRFNLISYTKQMDNETVDLYIPDPENGYKIIPGTRVYRLYFILEGEGETEGESFLKKYCILINRSGIQSVTEVT